MSGLRDRDAALPVETVFRGAVHGKIALPIGVEFSHQAIEAKTEAFGHVFRGSGVAQQLLECGFFQLRKSGVGPLARLENVFRSHRFFQDGVRIGRFFRGDGLNLTIGSGLLQKIDHAAIHGDIPLFDLFQECDSLQGATTGQGDVGLSFGKSAAIQIQDNAVKAGPLAV